MIPGLQARFSYSVECNVKQKETEKITMRGSDPNVANFRAMLVSREFLKCQQSRGT